MEANKTIVGAVLLAVAGCAYLHYGTFPESPHWVVRAMYWLKALEWWKATLIFFMVFAFPDYILKGVQNAFALVIATGLVLKGYSGTLIPMFSKKKKGLYGDASFMGWWDQWKFYYNTRNKGWAIGEKQLPDQEGPEPDISVGGVAVVGGMGVGKSSAIIIISIFRFAIKGLVNMFVNDPSGNIHYRTSGFAQSMGYKIYRLSTLKNGVGQSLRFNPLSWCKNITDITILAEKLVEMQEGDITSSASKHFLGGAKTLLTGVLAAAWKLPKKYRNLPNAYKILLHYGGEKKVFGEAIEKYLADDEMLSLQWASLCNRPEKELGSVISTAEQALGFAGNPTMAYILSGDEFDLHALRNEKMIFYNQFSETQTIFAPINALLLSYCLDRCIEEKLPTDTDYRGVRFLLDETYCLGFIPGLAKAVNNFRKKNVGVCLILQGISQLRSIYKSAADIILDGIQTTVLFRGLKPQYYEVIQRQIGFKTIEDEDGRKHKKELISIPELEQMSKSKCIIKLPSLPLIKTDFKPYYKISAYNEMSKIAEVQQLVRDITQIPYMDFSEMRNSENKESSFHNIESKIVKKDGYHKKYKEPLSESREDLSYDKIESD